MYEKTIVCLANSDRPSGRCIAGVEFEDEKFGDWIRPISNRPTHEISRAERVCTDGREAQPLDVIRIGFSAPQPCGHQTENHAIAPGTRWVRERTLVPDDLAPVVDLGPDTLWQNNYSSTHGMNDYVPESHLAKCDHSLRLIRPERLTISVGVEVFIDVSRRRARAHIDWRGNLYWIGVTDPVAKKRWLAEPDGDYDVTGTIVCVSLGEPFNGRAYKLAATLI